MLFSLPVLMYHSISNHKHRLCTPPAVFAEHCRVLAEAGWRGISLAEAEDYFLKRRRLPDKTCLFTFDDGYLDNYVYAEPLLRRHGHHGVIFPVISLIKRDETLRPNLEALEKDPAVSNPLAHLDARPSTLRNGRRVAKIDFCTWGELKHMRQRGNLSPAPHSMHHSRVVRSLLIKGLYFPRLAGGFFGGPPFPVPFGFPRFDLGHALADRAWIIDPKVFDLVREMVPQEEPKAVAFLQKPENRRAVLAAVSALPRLGELESEADFLQRVETELTQCREVFEREFGFTPISFCWPWGDFNPVAVRVAQDLGFRVFFATGRGPNLYGQPEAVRRIGVRRESGRELLRKLRLATFFLHEKAYAVVARLFDHKAQFRSKRNENF
jgi:peptidoglycan/xylan/chitin deacetylase (PgdA/CDA1 family)